MSRLNSATFDKWKARLGGFDGAEAQRLNTLEYENARDEGGAMLDNVALKCLLGKSDDARRLA